MSFNNDKVLKHTNSLSFDLKTLLSRGTFSIFSFLYFSPSFVNSPQGHLGAIVHCQHKQVALILIRPAQRSSERRQGNQSVTHRRALLDRPLCHSSVAALLGQVALEVRRRWGEMRSPAEERAIHGGWERRLEGWGGGTNRPCVHSVHMTTVGERHRFKRGAE